MSETGPIFPNLAGHQYANLVTYRKSGVAVSTPIWFAIEQGTLYVVTGAITGKVKRIRNNPKVLLEPSDARGKTLGEARTGTARLIEDGTPEAATAKKVLDAKYGLFKQVFDLVVITLGSLITRLQGKDDRRMYIAIVPADTPGE